MLQLGGSRCRVVGTAALKRCRAVQGAAVPKLVPRVILELAPQDMVELVSYPETAVQLLLEECQVQRYDGMVRLGCEASVVTSVTADGLVLAMVLAVVLGLMLVQ
jgi:hypothetical protein